MYTRTHRTALHVHCALNANARLNTQLCARSLSDGGESTGAALCIEPEAGATQRELRWMPHAPLCSWFCRGCPPRVLCRRAAADPAEAH